MRAPRQGAAHHALDAGSVNRRSFLHHATRTAAGLFVADDALELLIEPSRKLWPGWSPQVWEWKPMRVESEDYYHEDARQFFTQLLRDAGTTWRPFPVASLSPPVHGRLIITSDT